MITALTTFILPKPITRKEARDIFLSTAPSYRGVPGLLGRERAWRLGSWGVGAAGAYVAQLLLKTIYRTFRKDKAEDGWKKMQDWFKKNGVA